MVEAQGEGAESRMVLEEGGGNFYARKSSPVVDSRINVREPSFLADEDGKETLEMMFPFWYV